MIGLYIEGKGYIMNTKRWLAIVAAVVLLFVSIGFKFTMSVASGFFNEMMKGFEDEMISETELEEGSFTERIAVLNLDGVIQDTGNSLFAQGAYQHSDFIRSIEKAGEDDTVKAILLKVDSPGGAVGETAQIHRALVEMQAEYDKPIYVSMGSMAASGGYYVSAPADKIFAEPATLTGSIGVIMESINFSGLAEKYGVSFNTIKSGKHKDIMSSSREMTGEERDILQSIIDEMYADFVDVIVDGRHMDESTVRKLGDGRIYTGRQAAANGLIDEVGNFDDTLAALKADYDLGGASVIQYGMDFGFFGFVTLQMKDFLTKNNEDVNIVAELIQHREHPRAMYLY
jgi:protease-4